MRSSELVFTDLDLAHIFTMPDLKDLWLSFIPKAYSDSSDSQAQRRSRAVTVTSTLL